MQEIKHYRDYIGSNQEKHYKTTLFQSEKLMLGLNCLDPGQEQHVHQHSDQDKFYFVLEGEGLFTIGDRVEKVSSGNTVWAAAGVPHGVKNVDDHMLVILMGIAPAPLKK